MSIVEGLWATEEVPLWDAVYCVDGRAWEVELDPSRASGLRLLEPLDLAAELREEPEWTSFFGTFTRTEIPENSGYVHSGECAYHGSAGWFVRTDADGRLVWVVHLGDSNPFDRIEIEAGIATFRSTNGVVVKLDITDPGFRPADAPE